MSHRAHVLRFWEEFAKETALPATLDAGEPAHRPGRPQQHRHQALARRLPGVEGGRALVALQLLQLGKHRCQELHLTLKNSFRHLEKGESLANLNGIPPTSGLWAATSFRSVVREKANVSAGGILEMSLNFSQQRFSRSPTWQIYPWQIRQEMWHWRVLYVDKAGNPIF